MSNTFRNNVMNITNQIITYKDIEEGICIEGDDFGIASYTIQPAIRSTFLSNPFLEDKSSCMVYLSRVDGIVGGREMFFPTKTKICGQLFQSLSASSLMVEERFRALALGADISLFPFTTSRNNDFIVYAGISKMALPLYRKLKFYDLSTPLMWQPRRTDFLFERLGMRGFLFTLLKGIGNLILKPYISFTNRFAEFRRDNTITVEEMKTVPVWVDSIISADNHDYMEFHNREWMQWVLTHNFFGREKDKQAFYAIYKNGKEFAFFLTKERENSIPEKNIKRIVFGSIIEWGSLDEGIISEYDVYRIALSTFSDDVDIVEFTSADKKVVKKMRQIGFIQHGDSHIVVKSLGKKYPDLGLLEKWRIRLGYGDVMFY